MESCPECGSERIAVKADQENHLIHYDCFHCGWEDYDPYEDVHDPMSVPWGFLL